MINKFTLNESSALKKQFVYKVEKGENLLSISKKFKTTREILIFINGIEEDVLAGEYILIEIAEGEEYTVRPTDTIEIIANNIGKFVYHSLNI